MNQQTPTAEVQGNLISKDDSYGQGQNVGRVRTDSWADQSATPGLFNVI